MLSGSTIQPHHSTSQLAMAPRSRSRYLERVGTSTLTSGCEVRPRSRRWDAAFLAVPVVVTVGIWLLFVCARAPGTDAAWRSFPLDDAWIHLVYARSLAENGGFAYNDGVPEAGMTSPLWVVLLAGIYPLAMRGGVDALVLGVKLVSLTFGIGVVVMLDRLCRDLGESRGVALLAATLAAANASLGFAAASGMEVSLFIFLVLVALRSALRGRPVMTGIAAGLLAVARPEGLMLFPVYAALLARREVRDQPHGRSQLVTALLLGLAPALVYSAFCLHATGAPLPNTFYAKFVTPGPGALHHLAFGWRHYVHDNLGYFTIESGSMLCFLGLVRLIRRERLRGIAVVAVGALLFVGLTLSRNLAPGHFFYWERWLIPSFPFFILLMAMGLGEIHGGLMSLRPHVVEARPPAAVVWTTLAWAMGALLLLPQPYLLRERFEQYAWNAQNMDEMNVTLGKWINTNLDEKAVIVVQDAGALRFLGQRTAIDLLGLNDHQMLQYALDRRLQVVRERGARYVIIFPKLFDEDVLRSLNLVPVHSVQAAHYTICASPQDVMTVFRFDG